MPRRKLVLNFTDNEEAASAKRVCEASFATANAQPPPMDFDIGPDQRYVSTTAVYTPPKPTYMRQNAICPTHPEQPPVYDVTEQFRPRTPTHEVSEECISKILSELMGEAAPPASPCPPSPVGYYNPRGYADGSYDIPGRLRETELFSNILKASLYRWIVDGNANDRKTLEEIAKDPNVDLQEVVKILGLPEKTLTKASEIYRKNENVLWRIFYVYRNRVLYEKHKLDTIDAIKKEAPSLETLLNYWTCGNDRPKAAAAGHLLDEFAKAENDPAAVGQRLQLQHKDVNYHISKAKNNRGAIWRLIYTWRRINRPEAAAAAAAAVAETD